MNLNLLFPSHDLNSGRYAGAGCGTSTDALFFSGSPEPAGVVLNESWNGSAWTETTDLNSSKVYAGGCGTTSSALNFGGQDGTGSIALTESWNGSTWTETGDLATARNTIAGAGGSNSSGLGFGGFVAPASTEEFTANVPVGAWATGGSLNTARDALLGAGVQTSAIAAGGHTSSVKANTELYNGSGS